MGRSKALVVALQVVAVSALVLIVYLTLLRSDDGGGPFGVHGGVSQPATAGHGGGAKPHHRGHRHRPGGSRVRPGAGATASTPSARGAPLPISDLVPPGAGGSNEQTPVEDEYGDSLARVFGRL